MGASGTYMDRTVAPGPSQLGPGQKSQAMEDCEIDYDCMLGNVALDISIDNPRAEMD